MKNFLSKNWRNIMIGILAIFVLIDLFFVAFTKPTVVEDFAENGPYTTQKDVVDVGEEGLEEVKDTASEGVDRLTEAFSEATNTSTDTSKLFVGVAIALMIVVVISAILDGKDEAGAKKK